MGDIKRPTIAGTINRLSKTLRHDILPILGRIPAYGRLVYHLAKSPDIANRDKSALLLAVGYQLSPVDLIPGFIPVIGQLDDLMVLLWAVRKTLNQLPPERADDFLVKVGLSKEIIAADMHVVIRALEQTFSHTAAFAKRGFLSAFRLSLTGLSYVGYLTYYLLQKKNH